MLVKRERLTGSLEAMAYLLLYRRGRLQHRPRVGQEAKQRQEGESRGHGTGFAFLTTAVVGRAPESLLSLWWRGPDIAASRPQPSLRLGSYGYIDGPLRQLGRSRTHSPSLEE